jgi:murein DD-endopeptidase MepM/ murein hydrolase activator NlpD
LILSPSLSRTTSGVRIISHKRGRIRLPQRVHGNHEIYTGEDWGAPIGSPIYAVKDGVVERTGRDNFGKLVAVNPSRNCGTPPSSLNEVRMIPGAPPIPAGA